MSTVPQDQNPRSRWIVYTTVGLLFVALMIVMLTQYRGQPDPQSDVAQQKAQQLGEAINEAGYPSPDVDSIARVLGQDGGAVCASPQDALTQGLLKVTMSNGAAGPGMRPVRIDRIVVGGQRLIIQTYCPEQLADFDEFVSTLSFSDTVKN
ncbi:hypothetical protein ACPPVT_16090 [Angustibacter sp. McL0619]|uniref:hypothetical protein n=1 Tax=Angustibacter sp. McL0619 TaxID=3415676 RepID=UPI003CF97A86